MKVIINVNKNSPHAKLNGLTFDVYDVYWDKIEILINGVITMFAFKQIIIVNIQNELQMSYDNYKNGDKTFLLLNHYCYVKNIPVDVKDNSHV